MKKGILLAISIVVLSTLVANVAGAADDFEIRGQVTNVGVSQFTWDKSTFAGFYYDIDKNLGAEQITFSPSNPTPTGATLSDQADVDNNRGVVYETHAQLKRFKYKPWGQYDVIGFLGDRYFTAYDPTVTEDVANANENAAFLYDTSKNRNLMTNEQISKILIDDNTEMLINSSSSLKLKEGYELVLKYVEGSQALVELKKDGQLVDTKIIQPTITGATMDDKTYYYTRSIGDTSDVVTIAVHFKNSIHGPNTDSATIDGIFQISDTPTAITSGQHYGKMSIRNVDATGMSIVMDNKDNQITLSKNKDVQLMQDIHIRTADQDGTADEPLRYYIYKNITAPGTYQLRGSVTNVNVSQFTWDNSTFSGLYYDIDKNLGAEMITFRLSAATPTGATLGDQADVDNNRGIVYETHAQLKTFTYKPWGQYTVIGFLGEGCFVSYDNTVTKSMKEYQEPVAYLYDNSQNENLMRNEQISKVLVDDNTEQTITTADPLKLEEGYQLAIKSVDPKGSKASLVLSKDGQIVDSKLVQPSTDNAKMSDQTYYYKTSLGDTTDIIQIAVHFKNCFVGSDTNIATVDGVFQLSDKPILIKPNQQYEKMSIRNVDATTQTITMDNKDNQITLSKNKDVVLMQNFHIKTADQDGTADNPLRYYIYRLVTVEPKTTDELTSTTNLTIPKNEETSGEQKPFTATINEGL
jgi:S-layer protein (TIGR01567 family)